MRVACVGDPTTVRGMRLAGAHVTIAVEPMDRERAEEAVEALRGTPDLAVAILTSDVARLAAGTLSRWASRKGLYPIIVEVPAIDGEGGEDRVKALVRRAVGMDLEKG